MKEISALDAPNASSNSLASAVAIWFRFGGPNLMVCSGAPAGLDAVMLGVHLLRGARVDRVVVVGSEPADADATTIHRQRRIPHVALRSAAACVVLEQREAPGPAVPIIGAVRALAHLRDHDSRHVSTVIGPEAAPTDARPAIDLARLWGDSYGALGVLQVAVAASLVARHESPDGYSAEVVCGDPADGWRSIVIGNRAALIATAPAPAVSVAMPTEDATWS
jgi:3-oxoacyl-[acyl-carrier-protein] synthase II